MIRDAQTALWEGAALTATAVSTNAYDSGVPFTTGTSNGAKQDFSVGEPMGVMLTVGVAAKVSGTTETYEFDLITATDSALTASVTTLAQFPFTNTQAATLLAAGQKLIFPFPPGAIIQRYVGAKFIGANTPTITVTAWIAPISMADPTYKNYTSAIVVL